MDNRKLGLVFIALGIFFSIVLAIFAYQVNSLVEQLMIESGGTCIKNGVCAHQQNSFPIYIGIVLIVATLSLGVYLIFFEKEQRKLEKAQERIVESLKESKKEFNEKERFDILLKGLNEEEQKILKAVKEQDGIMQSTLRIRTDMSKTKLSLVLKDMEEKNLIKKVEDGKKNKVFLRI